MIRSRWFLIPFLLSVLLADAGMSQDQALAVSAGRDGTAQITLASGKNNDSERTWPSQHQRFSYRTRGNRGLAC